MFFFLLDLVALLMMSSGMPVSSSLSDSDSASGTVSSRGCWTAEVLLLTFVWCTLSLVLPLDMDTSSLDDDLDRLAERSLAASEFVLFRLLSAEARLSEEALLWGFLPWPPPRDGPRVVLLSGTGTESSCFFIFHPSGELYSMMRGLLQSLSLLPAL